MANKLQVRLEGVVEGMADDGSGILAGQCKPIFIANTIPGETVCATTRRKARGGIQADLDRVVNPSTHRREPSCPYAGVCGGCKWQHIAPAHQVELKHTMVAETFAKAGIEFPLESVEPCPEPFYYRNRMDYVFGANGDLGLKEPRRWWSVLDLSTCLLLSPEAVEIMSRVRQWTRQTGLPYWDMRTQQGFFRYLVIREGKNTGDRLVMLVTHLPADANTEATMRDLPTVIGELATSVVWGINPRVTDLSIAEEIIPLNGEPFLTEMVNGLRYRLHPNSFLQTNSLMAARLQSHVRSLCEPLADKSILDLYCGSGFFTLALSGARRLTGIELDAAAIEQAKWNAHENGIRADFVAERAEAYDWLRAGPQVVIVDPPRSGLHPDVIKTLRRGLPERIIYVSCNYRRLAQELPFFLDAYHVVHAKGFDLFPHTPHVEIVTQLERV